MSADGDVTAADKDAEQRQEGIRSDVKPTLVMSFKSAAVVSVDSQLSRTPTLLHLAVFGRFFICLQFLHQSVFQHLHPPDETRPDGASHQEATRRHPERRMAAPSHQYRHAGETHTLTKHVAASFYCAKYVHVFKKCIATPAVLLTQHVVYSTTVNILISILTVSVTKFYIQTHTELICFLSLDIFGSLFTWRCVCVSIVFYCLFQAELIFEFGSRLAQKTQNEKSSFFCGPAMTFYLIILS